MRGSARAALTHPLALLLLSASLAIAVVLLLVPALRPWSARASLVAILGLVAYVMVVVIVYWSGPEPRSELRTLLKIRDGIAGLRATGPGRAVLQGTIADAVRILDDQLIPTMRTLLGRQEVLEKLVARYRSGELPAPVPDVLARLRGIQVRIGDAIDTCLQQATNAHAALVALLQAGDHEDIQERARAWANDLLVLYDSLTDVLRGTDDDPAGAATEATPPPAPAPAPPSSTSEPTPPPPAAEPAPPRATEPMPPSPNGTATIPDTTASNGLADVSSPAENTKTANGQDADLLPLIKEALRSLNDRSKLSECRLTERLPHTFRMMREHLSLPDEHTLTTHERAHLIRQVMLNAIERLKPEGNAAARDDKAAHQHLVMKHRYIDRMAYKEVELRLSISQKTVHRRRDEALIILDRDLTEQEARLARDVAR